MTIKVAFIERIFIKMIVFFLIPYGKYIEPVYQRSQEIIRA